MKITTVGIDLAKEVFQIHGVDERGKAILRKQVRRKEMGRGILTEVKRLSCTLGDMMKNMRSPFVILRVQEKNRLSAFQELRTHDAQRYTLPGPCGSYNLHMRR